MKTFASALLFVSVYGSKTQASTEIQTGATAEIAAAVESFGYANSGIGHGYGYSSYSYDSYSSDYSHSDYFSSDYSDHDYGYGYRSHGGASKYYRYRTRYNAGKYLYGSRYASSYGSYYAGYRSYPVRSYRSTYGLKW